MHKSAGRLAADIIANIRDKKSVRELKRDRVAEKEDVNYGAAAGKGALIGGGLGGLIPLIIASIAAARGRFDPRFTRDLTLAGTGIGAAGGAGIGLMTEAENRELREGHSPSTLGTAIGGTAGMFAPFLSKKLMSNPLTAMAAPPLMLLGAGIGAGAGLGTGKLVELLLEKMRNQDEQRTS